MADINEPPRQAMAALVELLKFDEGSYFAELRGMRRARLLRVGCAVATESVMKPIDEKSNRETINRHIRQIVRALPPGIGNSDLVAWVASDLDQMPEVRAWFEKAGEIGPGTKDEYLATLITVEIEEMLARAVHAEKVSLQ
jgi:hypothetical protein